MKKTAFLLLICAACFQLAAVEKYGNETFSVEIEDDPAVLQSAERMKLARFDTLGYIRSMKFNGEEILLDDGLADEFNIHDTFIPPGYNSEDRLFMKYGIGILRNNLTDRPEYTFYWSYPVEKFFPVTVEKGENTITFRQSVPEFKGVAYDYTKTYTVNPETHEIVIAYTFKNTGAQPVHMEQYNHNFFRIQEGLDSRDFYVGADFFMLPTIQAGETVIYRKGMISGLYMTKQGCFVFSRSPVSKAGNHFFLRHPVMKYQIDVRGDFDSDFFAVSLGEKNISPEIYVEFTLEPGETHQWKRMYKVSGSR